MKSQLLFTSLLLSCIVLTPSCSKDKNSKDSTVSAVLKTLGGNGVSTSYGVTQDNTGNLYIGGYFTNNTTDANEFKDYNGNQLVGVGTALSADGYLAKIDRNGNQAWIKTFGGEGFDSVQGVTTDGTNLYVIGKFTDNTGNINNTVDFAGTGLPGLAAGTASSDLFIAKLNSNGTQEWIKTLGGTDNAEYITSVMIDKNGNSIYVGGVYYNSSSNTNSVVDFSGAQLSGRSNSASQDAFVAKLSVTDGAQEWIKTLGGTGVDRVYRMAQDSAGSIIVPGYYSNTDTDSRSVLDFSNTTLPGKTTTNSSDGFVAKLERDGSQTWIRTYGGTTDHDFLDAAIVDGNDNIFIIGAYGNNDADVATTVDFAGNALPGLTATSSREVLLAKLTSAGTQEWIKTLGGAGSDRPQGLGRDQAGNLYVAGYFNNNSVDVNAGIDFAGEELLGKSTAATGVDGFVAKLTSSGDQEWVRLLGGNGNDVIEGMHVGLNGNIGVVGYMENDSNDTNTVTDFIGEAIPGKSASVLQSSFVIRYSP